MFEVTQDARNTPGGAYYDAKAELDARIRTKQGEEVELLKWGDGFLSFKACREVKDPKSGQNKADCKMTTPGSLIQDAVGDSLTFGTKKLIVADEIDEVVSAIFAGLAQKLLTGLNGMLGLGGSGGGGGFADRSFGSTGTQTYLEALQEDAEQPRVNTAFEDEIAEGLNSYDDYIAANFDIVERIQAVLTELAVAQSDPRLVPGCFSMDVPDDLRTILDDALAIIDQAGDIRTRIIEIQEAYFGSLTLEEQQAAIDDYETLLDDRLIATELDVLEVELYIEQELIDRLAEVRTAIEAERQRCVIQTTNN